MPSPPDGGARRAAGAPTAPNTLAANTFWYGLVTLAGLVAGLVMSIVLARGLGPALMGDYSYLLWLSRTITTVATLALVAATVRYTAQALAEGDAGAARGVLTMLLRWQLVATAVVVALVIPTALLVASPETRWPLVAVALSLFPYTIEGLYTSALYGARRYDLTTRNSLVKMALHLAAAALVVWMGFGILGLVIGMSLGTAVTSVVQRHRVNALYRAPATPVSPGIRADVWQFLVPQSLALVLDGLVWDRSEVFFLGLWTSSRDIAFYSLAFGLATKAMLLPDIVSGALLPTFANLHGLGEDAEFRRVYRTAVRYAALAGTPLAILGTALAAPVMTLLYGAAYLPAAALFAVLIWVALLAPLRKVAWYALGATGDHRFVLTATAVSAVVNLGLAAWLIKPYGTAGAVVANAAAQAVATAIGFAVMARTRGCTLPLTDLARIALGGVAALGTTLVIPAGDGSVLRMLLEAAASLAVYGAVCAVTGVVRPHEWSRVHGATRRILAGVAA